MKEAEENRRFGEKTIVFVDEIHRFNKAQQDAFLPFVEKGSIILIGATTENPSFEVNGALLSRGRVFVLKALSENDIARSSLPGSFVAGGIRRTENRHIGGYGAPDRPFCKRRCQNSALHTGNGRPERGTERRRDDGRRSDGGTVYFQTIPSRR